MKKISWDSISNQKNPAEAGREQLLRAARSAAIRHIGIAARSSGSVRTFLEREGHDREIIAEVISGLFEEGYLDDRRPARRILRERSAGKSESRSALRSRLIRQGISAEVIEAVSEDMRPDDESAAELIRNRYSSELRTLSSLERESRRRLIGRIGRFMQSRGYSVTVISRAISTVMAEAGTDPDDRMVLGDSFEE